MFELAMPWILLMIIVPPFIWFLTPRTLLTLQTVLELPFYNALINKLDNEKRPADNYWHRSIFFSIWVLLLFAAAGPRWIGEPISLTREGRNIMLVLDLSGSMAIEDMVINGRPISRLAVVKRAAKEFVQARTTDRVGLILFGSQAYLQTPLTFDHHNVLLRIEDATVGLAGKTTSLGDALGLAVKRLQNITKTSRVIILLTDGANNSGVLAPLKAAELAKEDNIKVYTIGLGSEMDSQSVQNMASGFLLGINTGSDLDEKTLQDIAKLTGGRYFRATDMPSLQAIYDRINQLEPVSNENTIVRPEKDYYPWPLAMALLLLLCLFIDKVGLLAKMRLFLTHHGKISYGNN